MKQLKRLVSGKFSKPKIFLGIVLLVLGVVLFSQIFVSIWFFSLMVKMPSWASRTDESVILEQTKQTACFLLNQSENKRYQLIGQFYALMDYGGDATSPEKLHLLLRVLFDVPKNQPVENAAVFGAWLGEGSPYPYKQTDFVNLLWPLDIQNGKLILDRPIIMMYIGPPYQGLAEYEYFKSNFPVRTSEELGCS